jgi:hypothetical protein
MVRPCSSVAWSDASSAGSVIRCFIVSLVSKNGARPAGGEAGNARRRFGRALSGRISGRPDGQCTPKRVQIRSALSGCLGEAPRTPLRWCRGNLLPRAISGRGPSCRRRFCGEQKRRDTAPVFVQQHPHGAPRPRKRKTAARKEVTGTRPKPLSGRGVLRF